MPSVNNNITHKRIYNSVIGKNLNLFETVMELF